MKKSKKGFVVSAVLYPLLVLFLAIIMGLLSMTDTRKRILDKMKLEITDNIFDDAACSCDTILAKLNYIIANGVGGSGGDTGSYAYNKLTLNVKTYEAYSDFPVVGNIIGDIAVLSTTPIKNYYVSTSVPKSPQEGTVWIVQDNTSNYYVTSDWNKIGISYVMQYESGKWVLKKSYVYNGESWTMLYYVPLKNGYVDLTSSDINAEITKTYEYTGEYQTFKAVFSGYYKVELWGAQGGTNNSSYLGGKGSYTSGKIYLNAGDILYIYVGGTTTSITGGWNGGGDGASIGSGSAGGGGGATDVRLVPTTEKNIWNEFESLKSRIMVAAGGGGGSYYGSGYAGRGGAGGGINGYDGITVSGGAASGTGGRQTISGMGLYDANSPKITQGGFGYGGRSYNVSWSAAGGGGGYYGGGGGSFAGGAGGGGSSYISGHAGCNSLLNSSSESQIYLSGSAFHYTGYYFVETQMIDGNEYSWTNIKNSTDNMPNYDGSGTVSGNSGNGYSKISLLTIQVVEDKIIESNEKKLNNNWNYDYSETYQIFETPSDGTYKIELWGSQGGTSDSTSYVGGKGAYTSGNIYLKKGTKLYIYVGNRYTNSLRTKGGWNGGGNGASIGHNSGSGGGGATDVRLVPTSSLNIWNEFESLKSRIMVAAGGGGGAYYNDGTNYNGTGGAGGGLIGYNGTNSSNPSSPGIGATQTYYGYSVYSSEASEVTAGGFGYGGRYWANWSSSGGGGGYYGGGGGSFAGAAGGGGSSYISGHNGCNSLYEESLSTNLVFSGSAYHYSGYYFTDTNVIDGNGYSWTSKKSNSSSGMPSSTGSSLIIGNTENGFAKITYLSEEIKTDEIINNYKISNEKSWNYYYSGTYQIFNAPKNGYYKVELWGAQGGTSDSTSYVGGNGAYTSGEIYLSKGTKLYVYVGNRNIYSIRTRGGWNGGGDGVSIERNSGSGGGGATDVRLVPTSSLNIWNEFESLKSRIMVAAGGGGGAYYNNGTNYNGTGGSGGGLIGYNGTNSNNSYSYGRGGTQNYSGYSYFSTEAIDVTKSGLGYGGRYWANWSSSGGGGGYYGGGGGSFAGAAGGGGSSYISGHDGCNSLDEESTYTNLLHTGSSYHYSGYYFNNTSMIDGKGYAWTSYKNSSVSNMPSYEKDMTITGNTSDGHAIITLLNETTLSNDEIENIKDKNENIWNYDYSETYQILNINKSGTYKVELWGAQGGISDSASYVGGKGAYTSGEIYLSKGTKLYVYVGMTPYEYYRTNGGWNGGGNGASIGRNSGSGGGGATDVRLIPTSSINIWNETKSLVSRIIVAAGGGGGAYYNDGTNYNGTGGAGGGLIGYGGTNTHQSSSPGSGGTQIEGGFGNYSTDAISITKAGFGYGGRYWANWSSSGGGSGWYGGGGGSFAGAAGGGGSSYISGHAGCIGVDSSSNPLTDVYSTLADSISYTNYKFNNTVMIDGNGYPWTTVKSGTSSGMPNIYGTSTQTGQSGNGYAKITYLGA